MIFIPESCIESLVEEDLGLLDLTMAAMGAGGAPGVVECRPKRACVVACVEEAARIFEKTGAAAEVLRASGSRVGAGEACLIARGRAEQLHASYKAAQNVMEYASGIATRTAAVVQNARRAAPAVEVAVTRKHFPGTKRLSLKAAFAGGAQAHRLGLYDSILVFDQHRVFAGGTEGFLPLVREMAARCPERKIAVEAGSPEEAVAFARAGADVVQCERFEPEILRETVAAVRAIDPRVKISAAGGVNADNAADYAATGVDILVTSWVYFGKPEDVKMRFRAGS